MLPILVLNLAAALAQAPPTPTPPKVTSSPPLPQTVSPPIKYTTIKEDFRVYAPDSKPLNPLEVAIAHALTTSPDIRIAQAELQLAQAKLDQTKLLVAQKIAAAYGQREGAQTALKYATEQLAMLDEKWLQKRPFVAVGEIGLDFYWDKTFLKEQYEAFSMQMQWALGRSIPIVIHTRNAMQETIDTVKPYADKGLRGIFHCFSGEKGSAEEIINMGFYLGIGGVITYKNAGLAEVLENISLEHIVLETDSPYLTPVPFRGKRNESSYLQYIIKKLAEVKKLTIEEVAAITTANAQKIFGGYR